MISGLKNKSKVKIFFPSSIAVYGPRKLKNAKEPDIIKPQTIYGCNKLAIEQFGTQRHEESIELGFGIDFRCLRFPGIISPYTIPFGGTTDFAPQMLHAAYNNERYTCKVDSTTTLPFLGIKNAVEAIVQIMSIQNIDLINMYNYFLKKINTTKIFNLDEESLFMEFEDKILND